MSFILDFVDGTEKEISNEIEHVIEENGIKEKILIEAQELAQEQMQHIIDPEAPEPRVFEGLQLDQDEQTEYLLVLEYLQTIGFKYTPSILKYESQNLELTPSRQELRDQLKINTNDRAPLLVQLVENRLGQIEDSD